MKPGMPILLLLVASCGSKNEEALWQTHWIDPSGTCYALVVSGSTDGTPLVGLLSRIPVEKQPRLTIWKTQPDPDAPGRHRLLIEGTSIARKEGFVLFIEDAVNKPKEISIPREEALRFYKDRLGSWDGPAFERSWGEVAIPRLKP